MNNRRGTTLITVIASIAILAIALTAAASAFISAAKLTKHASDYTTASEFAQSTMERVMTQPFGSIETSKVSKDLPDLPGARCDISVESQEPLLKQITVTFTWNEGKTPRSLRLCTLVSGGGRR